MNLTSINQSLLRGLKPLTLGLGIVCVLSLASSLLSAATIDDLQFTLIHGDTEYSVSAVDPTSIAGALDIPATYNGKPVTEIPLMGFGVEDDETDRPDITSVTLPTSIKTIGDYSFNQCRALTSVVLPDSLTSIGIGAFSYCTSLTSIVLPNSITVIEMQTFFGCHALISVVLPDSLTELWDDAFYSCYDLASITFLGSAPTLLGADVFLYAGRDVGGLTLTIYDTHEDSYASFREQYNQQTYHIILDPAVMLAVTTSYTPSNHAFSIITHNEDGVGSLTLEHTSDLGEGEAWNALGTSDYQKDTDAETGAVTRTINIDPTTNPSGFYRLISADSPNSN